MTIPFARSRFAHICLLLLLGAVLNAGHRGLPYTGLAVASARVDGDDRPSVSLPQATPTAAGEPTGRALAEADAAWAAWSSLTPEQQAKVDPRILDELQGRVLPAYQEGGLSRTPSQTDAMFTPLPRTRFVIHLQETADLAAVDQRVYASQADRRGALVDELRSVAQRSQAGVMGILAARSGDRTGSMPSVTGIQPFFIINAIAVEADLATLIELAQRPDVPKIVANYPLVPILNEPTDVEVDNPGGEGERANDDHFYHWNLTLVQADRVHKELGIRGAGAVVGGFDTGVNYRHPALLRQYRGNVNGTVDHNYNWFVPDGELYANGNLGPSVTSQPSDCASGSHGTHTMGTMVGDAGGNAVTIGMAPDARWIAVPGICSSTMAGGVRDDIGGLKAFQWFLCPTDLSGNLATADCSKAPDVINNSWGTSNPVDDTFRPIIQILRRAGIAPVFAAGNPSAGLGSIGAPANAPEAITVGATDEYDNVIYFSGLGPSFYPGEQKPELSAPGYHVYSSVGSSGYESNSGTSMAAPHVAGLIALLVSTDLQDGVRDFDVDDLERLITISAQDLGEPGPDDLYGYGRINALAAVQLGLTAGDLRGQVFDKEYGTPVPFVQIEAYHPGLDKRFAARADATGVYSLTLPAGIYQVTLSGWGYETTAAGNHTVVADALSLVNFSLLSRPKATISGVVRDENGPVANALVYPAGNPSLHSRSGVDGRYQILLPLGPDVLVVTAPKHRILRQPVQTPGVGAAVDVKLKSAPTILLVDTSPLGGFYLGWPIYRFFTRALDEEHYQYDLWRIQSKDFLGTRPAVDGSQRRGLPSAALLKGYDLVIWVQSNCNDERCADNTPEEIGADPILIEYLDAGGRLFISGQNMGRADNVSVLFDEYLQADWTTSYGAYTGDAVNGAEFLSDLRLRVTNGSLYGYPNSYDYMRPDAVKPQSDGVAYPVLLYPDGEAAALAVAPCNASYRAFYLAAGYENLAPRGYQSQPDWTRLLDLSIDWLMGQGNENRYAVLSEVDFQTATPNGSVLFPFSITNLSNQSMRFAISQQGNRWPTSLLFRGAGVTGPIEVPGCTRAALDLSVDLPSSVQLGQGDSVTVTVVSLDNPGLATYRKVFQTRFMPQWSEETPLSINRHGMSTLALTNSYHVIGGWSSDDVGQSGEPPAIGPLVDHQRFDPCIGAWEKRAPLPEPRNIAAAATIGDRFYIAGGEDSQFKPTNSLFIYDRKTDSWSRGAPMPRALYDATGVAVGGKFYVFGGSDGLEISLGFLAYDPATNTWQAMGPMAGGARQAATAAVLNDEIYLTGGVPNLDTFVRYTPATNTWHDLPSPYWGRFGASLVAAADGYLYLLGGGRSWEVDLVERYHPPTATWSAVNFTLENDRIYTGGTYVDGKLYLVGGLSASPNHESLRLAGSFCESALFDVQTAASLSGEIVYSLEVQSGDRAYPNAHIVAPLDPGQIFAGFRENTIGAVYSANHAIEWSGTIPAYVPPMRLSYVARVQEGLWQPGDRITHTVQMDNGRGSLLQRSAPTQLFLPDFSASSKQVSQNAVAAGTTFSYTIDLRSNSPVGGPASFTDPLPPTLDFVAVSPFVGPGTLKYDSAAHTVHWDGLAGEGRSGFVNLSPKYIWADTLDPGSASAPEFIWQDIRSTGEPIVSGSDDIVCEQPVGFAFPFFEDTHTEFCVDVNGYVTFGDLLYDSDNYNDCPLPNTGARRPRIAGVWSSLAVDDAVYRQTFGQAPHRYTILQWADARPWDVWDAFFGTQRPPDTDFQIVLHEDGRVQVHVLRLGVHVRQASTTGLQGPFVGQSVTYQCDGSNTKLHDEMSVEFLPPGGTINPPSEQISFLVKAKEDTPVNSVVTNTVRIQSGQETYTRTAALVVQSVDLAASTKSASQANLFPGETVAYTVTLTNQGVAPAHQSSLSDTLPAALTYTPGTLACSSGVCNESSGHIAWNGTLLPGATVSIVYRAALNSVLPDKTPLTNTAEIRTQGTADIRRSVAVYARSTNLSASFIAFEAKPNAPGDRLTVTANLRNTGLQNAAGDFSLALPPEMAYVDGSLRCGTGTCWMESGRIRWSGTLPPRGLVAVQMDVRLALGLASGQRIRVEGTIIDQAWGQTQTVTGEMFVAFYTLLVSIDGDGTEPPVFLPLVNHQPRPPVVEFPVTPVVTRTPTPQPTTTPFPSPTPHSVLPTLTPTPSGR